MAVDRQLAVGRLRADPTESRLSVVLEDRALWTQFHRLTNEMIVTKHGRYDGLTIRYDTIRDAILTCARKPTRVGLIYRTEPTTKKCKTEKLKSRIRYVRSNSKSLGNHVVSSEEEKERLQWKGFAEKGFKSGMKEIVGDEKLITVTNKRNC